MKLTYCSFSAIKYFRITSAVERSDETIV